MQSWWNKKYGRDSICGITHVRLRSGKNITGQPYVIFLSCTHGFYRKAIKTWIQISFIKTCPICRKTITNQDIKKINS